MTAKPITTPILKPSTFRQRGLDPSPDDLRELIKFATTLFVALKEAESKTLDDHRYSTYLDEMLADMHSDLQTLLDSCTCRAGHANPLDINPPEIKRDRECPLHGD